ncbi:unnamed protein product [Peronospora destructor]|uniref:Thioredoxin domain-containing protein n=1 Tax=Peronospora destructor TaxID=86335 RepID=A0AAV0V9T7_9STRA|nr:unnamed protein product [Peronospora destructor]
MIAISSAEDFHVAVAATTEKPLVVFFSAPWCGGCKMVAPKVATLAEELAASATFVQVSAEELKTLCDEIEVDRFPHFRVYKESKIGGDYTSSKFDNVDAFIRELIAPDTLHKREEETPESDETVKEDTRVKEEEEIVVEGEEGTKKRQEREEMESNDEHVVKKARTDVTAAGEVEKVEEIAEAMENVADVAEKTEDVADVAEKTEDVAVKTEDVAEEVEEVVPEAVETTNTSPEEAETTNVTSEVAGKKLDELLSADKIDSSDVTALDAALT